MNNPVHVLVLLSGGWVSDILVFTDKQVARIAADEAKEAGFKVCLDENCDVDPEVYFNPPEPATLTVHGSEYSRTIAPGAEPVVG